MFTIMRRIPCEGGHSFKRSGAEFDSKATALAFIIALNASLEIGGRIDRYVVFDPEGNEVRPYEREAAGV